MIATLSKHQKWQTCWDIKMYFMSIIVASQLKSLNILSLLPPSFLSSFFKQIITVSSILLLYYQFPSCNRLNSCCLGFGLGCSSAQLYLLYLYYHFTYNKNIFFKNKVVSLCNYCNRKKCISIFNKMLYSNLTFIGQKDTWLSTLCLPTQYLGCPHSYSTSCLVLSSN